MTRLVSAAALAILFAAYAPPCRAYSATVSVHKLLAESQLVVVAEIVSVTEPGPAPERQRVATARILEVWKGKVLRQEIELIASPGWFACDTSTARVGETAILFLSKAPEESRPRIAHFGRGRLPVGTIGGTRVAFIYEVKFPPSVPVRHHGGTATRESVDVASLKAFVKELM